MDFPMTATIPLRNRSGVVVASAVVDQDRLDRVLALGGWHRNQHGYAVRMTRRDGGGRAIQFLHHVVFGEKVRLDHINRDRLDNRVVNLRPCTQAENVQNQSPFIGGTSVYRGVYWNKKIQKWQAQGKTGGKRVYLGVYADELDAAAAAAEWRRINMPFSEEALSV